MRAGIFVWCFAWAGVAEAGRIENPILDALYKRCDDPLINALLGPFDGAMKPETCDLYLNVLRLERTETVGNSLTSLTFLGGVLQRVKIMGKTPAGGNSLPFGLELGVTTAREIKLFKGVVGSGREYRLDLRSGFGSDYPFVISLLLDASTGKLQSVSFEYQPTPAEIAARDAHNKAEKAEFERLLARVKADLNRRSAPVASRSVAQPTAGASPPATTANPAGATATGGPGLAQFKNGQSLTGMWSSPVSDNIVVELSLHYVHPGASLSEMRVTRKDPGAVYWVTIRGMYDASRGELLFEPYRQTLKSHTVGHQPRGTTMEACLSPFRVTPAGPGRVKVEFLGCDRSVFTLQQSTTYKQDF